MSSKKRSITKGRSSKKPTPKYRERKITLSFSKFVEYVEIKHHFKVVSTIVDVSSNLVKFIECKTPIRQKTFYVFITKNYVMKAPDDKYIKKRVKYLPDEEPSRRSKEFMHTLRGRLACDMLFISSNMVYMSTPSDKVYCFITSNLVVETESEDDDEITSLKKKLKNIQKKITIPSLPPPSIAIPSSSTAEGDDLVFKDEDGEEYDPIKSAMNAKVGTVEDIVSSPLEEGVVIEKIASAPKPLEPTKNEEEKGDNDTLEESEKEEEDKSEKEEEGESEKKIEEVTPPPPPPPEEDDDDVIEDEEESEESEDDDEGEIDNETPNIDVEGIVLGMSFVLIDIKHFFSKFSTFENELIEYYDTLDENEKGMRQSRISDIASITTDIVSRVKECIGGLSDKEAKLKTDIARTSTIILKISSIKNTIESDASKYESGIISEINQLNDLYASARGAVDQYNIQILKIRDKIDDILYNVTLFLEQAKGVCGEEEDEEDEFDSDDGDILEDSE